MPADEREDVFTSVEIALLCPSPVEKCAMVNGLARAITANFDPGPRGVLQGHAEPGRPESPTLVPPRQLVKRRLGSKQGRLALIHAIAHIEFNAINLALDAAWRFRGLPIAYYEDWLRIAADEARHFGWLTQRLRELGSAYGELPAHNGLWEAAWATAHDPLDRMALVPRVLEARGLDVTVGMIQRLRRCDDEVTADILENILREEVAHVQAGTRWFRYLCEERGLEADTCFTTLLSRYRPDMRVGQLNLEARRQSGFSKVELDYLSAGGGV